MKIVFLGLNLDIFLYLFVIGFKLIFRTDNISQ